MEQLDQLAAALGGQTPLYYKITHGGLKIIVGHEGDSLVREERRHPKLPRS
jgi:hypothetical protein